MSEPRADLIEAAARAIERERRCWFVRPGADGVFEVVRSDLMLDNSYDQFDKIETLESESAARQRLEELRAQACAKAAIAAVAPHIRRAAMEEAAKVYVLIGKGGEYENAFTDILGVFYSENSARSAIIEIDAIRERQWALYQERERIRDEYLNRFEPDKIFPPGPAFTDGCVLYRNEQYKEADDFCGPAPELISSCDDYEVRCFRVDCAESIIAAAIRSRIEPQGET